MKKTLKLFIVFSFLVSCSTLKAQTAVYVCSSTGAYGFCYGNSSVSSCARNKCVEYGGKSPYLILSVSAKGYGAIAVGESSNGTRIVGASAGYSSLESAKNRALQECKNRGGQNPSISETFKD